MMVADKCTVAHHYQGVLCSSPISAGGPSRWRRLAQEAATWSHSLPLSASSTIFVRCDSARLDVLKALIIGPADTPYANGCFVFDVYFPSDYPGAPLQIWMETTGGGRVRFNPNLYQDGAVCLSLLNTFEGKPEELWNPLKSTLLQVLVSIQSLILVAEPIFNGPGNEQQFGTAEGTHASRAYNHDIRTMTMRYAILAQLRSRCPIFGEVMRTHFWLKRKEICQQAQGWINEVASDVKDYPSAHNCLKSMRDDLKVIRKCVYKLPKPKDV